MSYELQPKRVEEFGFGGVRRVVDTNPSINKCLRRQDADLSPVALAEVYDGNKYVWAYEVCGRKVYTVFPNEITRLNSDGNNIKI